LILDVFGQKQMKTLVKIELLGDEKYIGDAHLVSTLDRKTIIFLLDLFFKEQFFDQPSVFQGGSRTMGWPPKDPETFRIAPANLIMDDTYAVLQLKIGPHEKRILFDCSVGPEFLKEIARTIDELVGTLHLKVSGK